MADASQHQTFKDGENLAASSTAIQDAAEPARVEKFEIVWATAGADSKDENGPDETDSTTKTLGRTSQKKKKAKSRSSKGEGRENSGSSSKNTGATTPSSKGKEKELVNGSIFADQYALGAQFSPYAATLEEEPGIGNALSEDFYFGSMLASNSVPDNYRYGRYSPTQDAMPVNVAAAQYPSTDSQYGNASYQYTTVSPSLLSSNYTFAAHNFDGNQPYEGPYSQLSQITAPVRNVHIIGDLNSNPGHSRHYYADSRSGNSTKIPGLSYGNIADYRVHKSKDFVPGKVLKLFWFEPQGARTSQSRDKGVLRSASTPGKVRRFVIVETRKGHSIGIPINTYGFLGTLKPGCHPEDHAMIYTAPEPDYLPGEAPLPNPKIRVRLHGGERLQRESRVNYGKKYTIEHNFSVAFIGSIAEECSNDFWVSFHTVNSSPLLYNPPSGTSSKSSGRTQSTQSRSKSKPVIAVDGRSSVYTQARDEHLSRTKEDILDIPLSDPASAERSIVRPVSEQESATENGFSGDQAENPTLVAADTTVEVESNTGAQSGVAGVVPREKEETISVSQPAITGALEACGADAVPADEVREYPLPTYEEAADAMRPFVQNNTLIPQENMECHNDLFVAWPETQFADVRRRLGNRTKETCEWILSKGPYSQWENHGGAQVLRLLGAKAAGKTMLITFLVEHWTLRLKLSSSMSLAYWFCDSGNHATNTATGIVRGVLYQILQQRPHNYHHLQQVYGVHGKAVFEDFRTLWTIFRRVLEAPAEEEIVILIDALDECDEHSRRLILDGLLEISKTKIKVRVLFAERPNRTPEPTLHRDDCKIVTLPIKPKNIESDIHKFTKEKVATLEQKNGLSVEQTASLTEALNTSSAGAFLGLIFNMLTKIEGCNDMIEAVDRLPADALSAYREYLDPDQDEASSAQNIFNFLDTLPGDPGREYKSFAERELRREKEEVVKPQRGLLYFHAPSSVPEATPESSDAEHERLCTDCKASTKSMTSAAATSDAAPWKRVLTGCLVLLALRPRLSVICGLLGFVFAAGILFTTLHHALIAFQSRHDIAIKQAFKQSEATAESPISLPAQKPSHSNTNYEAPTIADATDLQESSHGIITVSNPNPYANVALPMHNGNQARANPPRNDFAFVASRINIYGRFRSFIQHDGQDPNNPPPPPPDPNDPAADSEFVTPDGFKSWIITCLLILVLLGFLSAIAQAIACTKLSSEATLPNYVVPTYDDIDFLELLSNSGFLLIDICFSMAVVAIHVAEHKNTEKWAGLYALNFLCFSTVPISVGMYATYKYASKGVACFGQFIQAGVSFWTIYRLEALATRQRWMAREKEMRRQRRDREEADQRHRDEIEESNRRSREEIQGLLEQLAAERARDLAPTGAGLRRRPVAGGEEQGVEGEDIGGVALEL